MNSLTSPHFSSPSAPGKHHSTLWFLCAFTNKSYHKGFVFLFLVYFTLRNPWLIHVVTNGRISFFLWVNISVCVCIQHFAYLVICWWKLRLFPYLPIMNNSAKIMYLQIHFKILFPQIALWLLTSTLVRFLFWEESPNCLP
jgi:hypothetical protein